MAGRIRRSYRRVNEDRAILSALFAALGAALVAGTLPDLLKLIPGKNATLAGILVIGFMVLAASWINLHGRTGVGVAVFLQPTPTSGWSDSRLTELSSSAKGRHINFFYVNVDELHPGLTAGRRASLTERVIEARLKEEESRNSSHISFYLTCGLANAFRLGQQVFNSTQGTQLRVFEFKEISVHQVSNAGPNTPLPPLVLHGTPLGPQATEASYQLTPIMRRDMVTLNPVGGQSPNRHALILNITNNPTMIDEAKRAARGVQGPQGRYTVSANDVCSSALIYHCTASSFPNDESAYNELLKDIVQHWSFYLSSQASSHGSPPEGRLFVSAPTSLAFSLGALLPTTTSVVEYI
ncbi:hypothetical protein ACFWHG_10905 [Streptomyces microflavus]|uniref:hypothetical protein n=1 Tax=Streptomyces microflavus TaxID=1919 RepID=UPI003666BD9D